MSKKTKRLEKENLSLTRKQEATNKNIFQMAEERNQSQQTIDRLLRENEKLKKLCRAMQSGGYIAPGVPDPAGQQHLSNQRRSIPGAERDFEGTESEYEDDEEEYDEDEDEEDEAEYDDDTEEDVPPCIGVDEHGKPMYGPLPPPPPSLAGELLRNGASSKAAQTLVNGAAARANGTGSGRGS